MRPTHPIVDILRNYARIYVSEYDIDNIFYCKYPIYWMEKMIVWECTV